MRCGFQARVEGDGAREAVARQARQDETARWNAVHFEMRRVSVKNTEAGSRDGWASRARLRGPCLIIVNEFIRPDGAPLCSKSLHYTCIPGWLSENVSPSIITTKVHSLLSVTAVVSFIFLTHSAAQFPHLYITSGHFLEGGISFASNREPGNDKGLTS